MGGNVFPGMNRRYSKAEYLALVDEMTPMFNMIFKVWNVTPTFSDKADFGDMDVVGVTKFTFNVDLLKAVFNLQPFKTHYLIKNNGGVWSLIYKDFQIDLVTCPEHEYEFTRNYMGVGDRGNFVGKIAHMLGLKFGHDGMWLVVRTDDNHQLGEVCLTLDPKEAEAFLDVKPLMDNPKSLEDIFDNVAASKYFNPEVFKLENINAYDGISIDVYPSIRPTVPLLGSCRFSDNELENLFYCSAQKLRSLGFTGEIGYIFQGFGMRGESHDHRMSYLIKQRQAIDNAAAMGATAVMSFGKVLGVVEQQAEPILEPLGNTIYEPWINQ